MRTHSAVLALAACAPFTMQELVDRTRSAARQAKSWKYSAYTSLGAAAGISVPILWGQADGTATATDVLRPVSDFGAGALTEAGLRSFKGGAFRGTLRGNAIVVAAITIADTAWLLNEHGWQYALSDPGFYQFMGGDVTSLVLGMWAGGAVADILPGPGWVVGTASLVGGAVVGTVGYMGGETATRTMFEIFAAEKLRAQERKQLAEVKADLTKRIIDSQASLD